jgi:hypothetical protein
MSDEMKTINLNDEVRAKLTDAGRKILRKNVDDNLGSHPGFAESYYNKHKEYAVMPLWELMEIFGHAMFMGNPSLPFESMLLEIVEPNLYSKT